MCHGYEMKWWKSEAAEKKISRAAKEERAKAAPEPKVEEKELTPAE